MTGLLTAREKEEFTAPCPTCNSYGFPISVLGPNRCEFCDGTEGGSPPNLQDLDMCEHDAVDSKLAELENSINLWGLERNITAEGGATVMSQMGKMTEEFAEFLGTWDKIIHLNSLITADLRIGGWGSCKEKEIKLKGLQMQLEDDFGDMLVCLINAMRLAGTDMETCLAKAWEDIKDRKGRMEGGKFIKES